MAAEGRSVFRPEDEGEHMAVDEKYIGREFYTVLTNADTGRIAMMCHSMDYPTLVVALLRFGCETLDRVKTVTRDLATTFESVCTMVFPGAVTDSGQVPRGDAPDKGTAGLPREAEERGREAREKGGKEPRGKIQGQRRKAGRRKTADEEEIPRADSPQWRNPCRDAAPMPLLALQVAARLDRQPAPAGQTAFLLLPKPQRRLRPVHTIPQMVHPGSRLWQRPKGLATVTVAQARQGNQAVPFQQLLLLG